MSYEFYVLKCLKGHCVIERSTFLKRLQEIDGLQLKMRWTIFSLDLYANYYADRLHAIIRCLCSSLRINIFHILSVHIFQVKHRMRRPSFIAFLFFNVMLSMIPSSVQVKRVRTGNEYFPLDSAVCGSIQSQRYSSSFMPLKTHFYWLHTNTMSIY